LTISFNHLNEENIYEPWSVFDAIVNCYYTIFTW